MDFPIDITYRHQRLGASSFPLVIPGVCPICNFLGEKTHAKCSYFIVDGKNIGWCCRTAYKKNFKSIPVDSVLSKELKPKGYPNSAGFKMMFFVKGQESLRFTPLEEISESGKFTIPIGVGVPGVPKWAPYSLVDKEKNRVYRKVVKAFPLNEKHYQELKERILKNKVNPSTRFTKLFSHSALHRLGFISVRHGQELPPGLLGKDENLTKLPGFTETHYYGPTGLFIPKCNLYREITGYEVRLDFPTDRAKYMHAPLDEEEKKAVAVGQQSKKHNIYTGKLPPSAYCFSSSPRYIGLCEGALKPIITAMRNSGKGKKPGWLIIGCESGSTISPEGLEMMLRDVREKYPALPKMVVCLPDYNSNPLIYSIWEETIQKVGYHSIVHNWGQIPGEKTLR